VNTISRDHVRLSVEGGFTQAGHGKPSGLKRLKADDWLVYYSPKTSLRDGEPLQAFTAMGRVLDEELYQVEQAPGSHRGAATSSSPGALRRRLDR
jgi:hypothetical protein